MKDIIKDMIRSSVISIGIAFAIFCLVGVINDCIYGGEFILTDYRFSKMIAGCVAIGLGYGAPSVIYRNDSLPLPVRVLVHMGIGCIVYTITAYLVGWMGSVTNIGHGILIAAVQLGVAFVIWFLFMRYYRNEARRMNERIQEMK